jgi:hypothetical protein
MLVRVHEERANGQKHRGGVGHNRTQSGSGLLGAATGAPTRRLAEPRVTVFGAGPGRGLA